MPTATIKSIQIIAVVVLCTQATRWLPFLLFGGNRQVPAPVQYLGRVLPPAVMATLVIYCLKDVRWLLPPHGAAELIAIAAVVLLHLWKRNTLLSIGIGTVLYMVLVQAVFV